MRLISTAIALASGASYASANVNVYERLDGGGGQPRQHRFNESNLNDLHTPNSTHSVNFNIGREEWTWRVNVTSLSVPDARLDLDSANGPPLPDPRVVITTFDLTWPNATATLNDTAIRRNEQSQDGSAQAFGNSSTYDPICLSVVATPMWPNVTNKLQDDNDGDCEAVLGEDCVKALLTQPSYKSSGVCAVPSVQLDACQGIFNTGYFQMTGSSISRGFYQDRDNFTTYYSNGDDPKFNMSYLEQTHGGEGVWFSNSEASPEPNTTALRQAESQLRVMLLTLPGSGQSKAAVCTRVDSSIDDVDVSPIAQRANWDGDEPSDGAGNGGDDGDKSGAGPRFAATVGSVGTVGLAVAVFGFL